MHTAISSAISILYFRTLVNFDKKIVINLPCSRQHSGAQ